MRNQLLRDADWAGMAHGVEIRVPLVDVTLLEAFAPALPALAPGAGKAALAKAPSVPLPAEIILRAKTGFSVPTGAWTNRAAEAIAAERNSPSENKGLVSRDWSKAVLDAFGGANPIRLETQRLAAAQ
jgi:asparagine synthase (glutamine-hydrolysing)